MTPSEQNLWSYLREIEGRTFRRQVAIDDLVFDFGEFSARLLIEIDGGIHDLPDVQLRDEATSTHAIANGFALLRLKNGDVWARPDWVVDQVRAALKRCDDLAPARNDRPSPPSPLSARERGDEL